MRRATQLHLFNYMLLPVASQYAICGLVRLAVLPPQGYCQIDDLVRGTSAPEHAVRKVFQQLAKHKLLRSVRGVRGGFCLGAAPAHITLIQVVEAVDGPWPATPWGENHLWQMGATCPLAKSLQPMWDNFGEYLRTTRISDLVALVDDPSTVFPTIAPLGLASSRTPNEAPAMIGEQI